MDSSLEHKAASLYQQGQYEAAAQTYTKCLKQVRSDTATEAHISLLFNRSTCCLKLVSFVLSTMDSDVSRIRLCIGCSFFNSGCIIRWISNSQTGSLETNTRVYLRRDTSIASALPRTTVVLQWGVHLVGKVFSFGPYLIE